MDSLNDEIASFQQRVHDVLHGSDPPSDDQIVGWSERVYGRGFATRVALLLKEEPSAFKAHVRRSLIREMSK